MRGLGPLVEGDIMTIGKRLGNFLLALGVCLLAFLSAGTGYAQLDFEQAPICYNDVELRDPVAALQQRVDRGELKLAYSAEHGYLPAVLEALGISPASQMLVFSKTSFQLTKISPHRPRAIYFNDKCYVGWVQNGDVVEISSVDPQAGAMFYTLLQEETPTPRFVRDKGQCIACHASSRTQGVPGHLVRSVYASPSGQPHFGAGTFTTDQHSPFKERWGGWYVTGKHGAMRHMGNLLSRDRDNPEKLDREAGANVTDLSDRLNVAPYLQPTSDIVALMVLEHQTQMHNFLTLANYTARQAEHQDRIVSEALQRDSSYQSESTQRRIATASEKLLDYMLFVKEFPLECPVECSSQFTTQFVAMGPRDSQGRSLRDFDLERRLFKYPCSYLIYSPSFDELPPAIKGHVTRRLLEVLTEQDQSEKFAHLSPDDRRSILEILRETKPDLFAATQTAPTAVSAN
jgi:hypothetical protein